MKNEQFKFLMIPEEEWNNVKSTLEDLNAFMRGNLKTNPIGDYITEKEAKQILGKSTTWFWNKRKSQELNGRKSGNVWYYSVVEIQKFIENGKRN